MGEGPTEKLAGVAESTAAEFSRSAGLLTVNGSRSGGVSLGGVSLGGVSASGLSRGGSPVSDHFGHQLGRSAACWPATSPGSVFRGGV